MKRWQIFTIACISMFLTGCISNVWTGVNLAYDRHNIYKKVSDFKLSANVNRIIYHNKRLQQDDCSIDTAVFNGDVLLVGYVPSRILRDEATQKIAALPGVRRLFNQIDVTRLPEDTPLEDSVITATIRSQIFSDSSIDPHSFKVVTSGQIVYLMGDVIPEQANHVIRFARTSYGVKRVVKLFKYYNLSDKPQ